MFKKTVAIFLLMSLLMANFSSAFVLAGFELNKKYIADTLCINKDKPELHCNGQCYLMKKLRQAEDKEQKQERQTQKLQVQDAVVVTPMVFKQYPLMSLTLHVPFSTGMPTAIRNSIFHPPQASAV